jgi:hypothetical protein
MKVMITTSGGNIAIHDKIVDLINALYDLKECGSNGGKGYYFTHADIDYPHISKPFSYNTTIKDVEVMVGTLYDEDEDDDEEDEDDDDDEDEDEDEDD